MQKEERYVKKGEKALFILAPIISKKEDNEELEKMEELISCFRSVPFFDISQTEGKALNYTKSNNKLISETTIKFNDLIKYSPTPVFLDNIRGGGGEMEKESALIKKVITKTVYVHYSMS